jgi:hypothetical protein
MNARERLAAEQDGAGALERLINQRLDALYYQCSRINDRVIVLNAKRVVNEACTQWKRERGLPYTEGR